jgi:hypothetical protein
MTSRTLQRQLVALPARQLNLLAIGTVAVAAALALSAVRAPLAKLRAQQARLAALAAAPIPAGQAPLQPAVPKAAPPKAAPPPTPLALIAAVSAGAQAAGVTVASAVPGPERSVAGMREQTLEVEASGGYAAILDWIGAIEARQPAVGVIRMDLRPAQAEAPIDAQAGSQAGAQNAMRNETKDADENAAQRLVKLRLGVYSNGSAP